MAGVTMVLGGEPEGEGEGEKEMPSSKPSDKPDGKAVRVEALRAFDEAMKAGDYEKADGLWEEYQAAREEM